MEEVRVLHHDADRVAERLEREVAHVVAVDAHRALHSRRRCAGTSIAIVVLPAPDGPTSATSSPGSTLKLTSRRIQSLGSSASWRARRSSSDGIDDTAAGGWRNHTWSNSIRPAGSTRSTAPGRSVIERREVEHLEHPLERHERGQHVDPRVRELRERLVDLARRRPRTRRACRRRWCRRSRGCRRRSRRSRCRSAATSPSADEQDAASTSRSCTPMSRTRPARSENVSDSRSVLAEELDDQRAGDVEPLGDDVVHRRVQLHALARETLQLRARSASPG